MKYQKSERNFSFRVVIGLFIVSLLMNGMTLSVYAEEYEYDDLDRVVKVVYDDGSYVEYKYDNNGNLLETVVSRKEDESVEKDAGGEENRTDAENKSDSKVPKDLGEGTSNGSSEVSQNDKWDKETIGKEIAGGEDEQAIGRAETGIPETGIPETEETFTPSEKKELYALISWLFDFLETPYGKILMWILKKLFMKA